MASISLDRLKLLSILANRTCDVLLKPVHRRRPLHVSAKRTPQCFGHWRLLFTMFLRAWSIQTLVANTADVCD
jgi:hypothetical protein